MSAVKCPACGKYVTPTVVPPEEPSTPAESGPGKRWSFIWVPPQGEVCPDCSFPLARFARRAKWLRIFMTGIVLVTVWLLLRVLAIVVDFSSWLVWVQRVAGGVGLVALLVGFVGLLVGGRRSPLEEGPARERTASGQ
jgi:hypothetical protein